MVNATAVEDTSLRYSVHSAVRRVPSPNPLPEGEGLLRLHDPCPVYSVILSEKGPSPNPLPEGEGLLRLHDPCPVYSVIL